jgi:ribonuclease E
MKRMLINATQPEELRVALVDGQRLYDLDIENRTRVQKKSNIYKGKITRVEPSLEAAFVDFGQERHGFLPLKEISREYFTKKPSDVSGRVKIKDVVKEGTEIIIQVDKEERGNKGAAISTFVSLAGRYLVLMPNNPRAGGISRRIEGDERDELREALSKITIPKGMGVIVRTAGVGRSQEDLQADLEYLLHLWNAIQAAHEKEAAPSLLYQESNVIIRAIRDYLRQDIDEVLIDTEEAFNEALVFIRQVMPHYESKIKLYKDNIPLFNRYQIESQIESAFQREVQLPSGGSIVIDPTEAMVAIDINSARATKGGDIEETALQTNVEAAEEIARQLRLRDMGGLVVIDFIDMSAQKNQREVENRMRKALQMDRARVQVGKISRFGLLEMSRQRLRPSLGETSSIVCPRCSGQGSIRDTKSLALSILRLLDEQAGKERSGEIRAIVPLDVATYLLNEKRPVIASIENEHKTRVLVIPDQSLETPHFEVVRLRDDDNLVQQQETSFQVQIDRVDNTKYTSDNPIQSVAVPEQAAVKTIARPAATAPSEAVEVKPEPAKQPGLLSRIINGIFGAGATNDNSETSTETKTEQRVNTPADRNTRQNQNSRNNRKKTGQNQENKRNNRDRDNRDRDNNRNDNTRGEKSAKPQQERNNKTQQERPKKAQQERGNDSGNEQAQGEQKRPQKRPQNKNNRGPGQRKRGEARNETANVDNEATQATENKNRTQDAPAAESKGKAQRSDTENTGAKAANAKKTPENKGKKANEKPSDNKTNNDGVTTTQSTETKPRTETKPDAEISASKQGKNDTVESKEDNSSANQTGTSREAKAATATTTAVEPPASETKTDIAKETNSPASDTTEQAPKSEQSTVSDQNTASEPAITNKATETREPETALKPEERKQEANLVSENLVSENLVSANKVPANNEPADSTSTGSNAPQASAMIETELGLRANNDPRVAPAAVKKLAISTEQLVLSSNVEAVIPVPRPKSTARASNDPRNPQQASSNQATVTEEQAAPSSKEEGTTDTENAAAAEIAPIKAEQNSLEQNSLEQNTMQAPTIESSADENSTEKSSTEKNTTEKEKAVSTNNTLS